MITKKTILLLLVFQICLIGESFGLNLSFENIVGRIKQIPSMATTIPPFLKNTLLPHSMRKTSLLFFIPSVINKFLDENSKYEAMEKYFDQLLSTNEKETGVQITSKRKYSEEDIQLEIKNQNPTEQQNWNHRKQKMSNDPNKANQMIWNKIKHTESLFSFYSVDYFNIKMSELWLNNNILLWKELAIIAGKNFTDYIFLALPIIFITLSILGELKGKTIAWSFIIPTVVAIIKIAHYHLVKNIYEKKTASKDDEVKNDERFKLLSSPFKNPSTNSLLIIGSLIFLKKMLKE
jgi:hypothetical protein